MKKIILLFIIIITVATAYTEQFFQVKFYRKNGLAPLKYNIYDINRMAFNKLSCKYAMTVYYKDVLTAEYKTIEIDSLKFLANSLKIHHLTGTGTFLISDIDSIVFQEKGANYETVTIGTQVWMKKNLEVGNYSNGDPIRYAANPSDWIDAANNQEGAWCYYDNDPANGAIYGRIYNWYAVNDPRGLAPCGYHIPGYDDWTTLESFLSSNSQYWCNNFSFYTAKSLAATDLWNKDNGTCTVGNNISTNNTSNFTALPGGFRDAGSNYSLIKNFSGWWSSLSQNDTHAWGKSIFYDFTGISWFQNTKASGYYVRCIKD